MKKVIIRAALVLVLLGGAYGAYRYFDHMPQKQAVVATANFTGSFHVQVDLLTDTSAPARISTGRLSIRSTAYNVVALALMAAAAAFILLSLARSMARRRVALQAPPAGAPVD